MTSEFVRFLLRMSTDSRYPSRLFLLVRRRAGKTKRGSIGLAPKVAQSYVSAGFYGQRW